MAKTKDVKIEVGTGKDIEIKIKDHGVTTIGSVQSYSVKCDINYTKIGAMGESVPNGYHFGGRLYTVTLEKVNLRNSKLRSTDPLSPYAARVGEKKDIRALYNFQLVITQKGVDGGKDRVRTFRNCFRIEAGEDATLNRPVIERMVIVSPNVNVDTWDEKYHRYNKMKYGNFKFPNNPTTTEYSSEHKYVEHKLAGVKKNDIEDFGVNCAVIHCEGKFYKSELDDNSALKDWNALRKEYKEQGIHKVYHPLFKDITRGLMINLQGHIDDVGGLVSYSFDIVEYNPPKVTAAKKKKKKKKPKKKKSGGGGKKPSTGGGSKKSGPVKSLSDLKVGDLVYLTGVCRYDSYGSKPHSRKYTHTKMTVTKIVSSPRSGQNYPILLGCIGWTSLGEISWT